MDNITRELRNIERINRLSIIEENKDPKRPASS